jgi:hypothetical protein
VRVRSIPPNNIEREFAEGWRSALANMEFSHVYPILRGLGAGTIKPRDFADARARAEHMVRGDGRRYKTIEAAFKLFSISPQAQAGILKRWKEAGRPALEDFAPYAAYNLKVDLFFYLCLQAGLISSQRRSNRVDIAYLYYLPFCMIFTSGDRLHETVTPFFLREDQAFLWAPKLKGDLGRLNVHYEKFPESIKGIRQSNPPSGRAVFLMHCRHDGNRRGWRSEAAKPPRDQTTGEGIRNQWTTAERILSQA